MTDHRIRPLALFIILASVSAASAEMIPIANHSFEEPALSEGVYNFEIPNWSQFTFIGSSRSGVWHATSQTFSDLSALDGVQHGFIWGPESIAQQLATGVIPGAAYELTALFGAATDPDFRSGGSLELWAGGSVSDGSVVNGTLLGALVVADDEVPLGSFQEFSATIVAPTSGILPGELLAIRFVANLPEAEIDNIRLNVVVPEPAVLVFVATAALGVTRVRRRRPI